MIHRFNYPAFRSAYIRAKTAQRARFIAEEQVCAYVTSVVRPTEFQAELRMRLSRSRLTLTSLEKRVLHYDRQYLRLHDGQIRSSYVNRRRALYIGVRAKCPPHQVARILEHAEWLFWAADIMGIEVELRYVTCARRRKVRHPSRTRSPAG